MTSLTIDVGYTADASAVYDAIARPDLWWCTDAQLGALIRLNWSPEDFVAFRADEATPPRTLRWTCVAQHDRNLPQPDEWVGTALCFEVREDGSLRFEHAGLVPAMDCYDACAGGWDFFLRHSLRSLIASGSGLPYQSSTPLAVARRYHEAWTAGRFDAAAELLARDVAIEVPVNEYADGDQFMAAVAAFGGMATRVETLTAHGGRDDALVLYDMDVAGPGRLRVAEHFDVRDGLVTRIRQVHDTHAIRVATGIQAGHLGDRGEPGRLENGPRGVSG